MLNTEISLVTMTQLIEGINMSWEIEVVEREVQIHGRVKIGMSSCCCIPLRNLEMLLIRHGLLATHVQKQMRGLGNMHYNKPRLS